VYLEVELVSGDVSGAFDVSSPIIIVADVYDEIVFGFALDECFEFLRGYVLVHPVRQHGMM
jgi:hypothetical protein